jgi:hypothetical protein
MIEKEITIGGVAVKIGYCFATELAFKQYTGVNIEDMDTANPEHIIYIILSAIVSYYEGSGGGSPVKDNDLMYKAKPTELIAALTEVFKMRAEWYELPKGEDATVSSDSSEEKEEQEPKNA